MNMTHLTSEAKSKLASTVRSLRGTKDDPNGGLLLRGLREQAQSVYRLDLDIDQADLAEEQREKRRRLEDWLTEQARADVARDQPKSKEAAKKLEKQSRKRHLTEAIKLAGATLLNRLVVMMQLEAQGMIKPAVVTGGEQSLGYREFRDEFGPALCKGSSDGYGFLLGLVYDELALELPGVFGQANAMTGLTELFPVPVSTLKAVVTALNDPALVSAWGDDTTLGWVYQYWNDPEREALDDKLNKGGKVEPHEIASKTQMFTERYMVEWLLQNSLGQQWLAICEKNGWTPEVMAAKEGEQSTLARLEARRVDWREKRERGEVALDALMPIETEAEARWKYWVQQPGLGSEGVPGSIREIRIFDPACGSGHFLVIAFDLLRAFYAEEARHRGESGGEDWSDRAIVESILENNLFGLDLDPRAVQIAAAALYLKAKGVCAGASPQKVNLVASNLNLAALPVDDPARQELRAAVEKETGIPGALTDEIVEALKGADAWGSLLQVDAAVEKAIEQYQREAEKPVQTSLLAGKERAVGAGSSDFSSGAKEILLGKIEGFLTKRTRSNDLGLRLRGEQLAVGVRFLRMVNKNSYDLTIGNPPYHSASKMKSGSGFQSLYPEGKADLFAAFMSRNLQLTKPLGLTASITLSNWMYLSTFTDLRTYLLDKSAILTISELGKAAFSQGSMLINTSMQVLKKEKTNEYRSVAIRLNKSQETSTARTSQNKIRLFSQEEKFYFNSSDFNVVKEKPILYWWSEEFLRYYGATKKLGESFDIKVGLQTGNNTRFTRKVWELSYRQYLCSFLPYQNFQPHAFKWHSYVKGASGRQWFEPLTEVIDWELLGAAFVHYPSARFGRGADGYFHQGVAFPKIGNNFSARIHTYPSIIGDAGCSIFPNDPRFITCVLNSSLSRQLMSDLNPTVNFQTGDVSRIPLFPIESANQIFAQLETAFTTHESAREPSVEFQHPAPTCWPYAQAWAQRAVDRPAGEPLPPWEPDCEDPKATDWISYAIGLALGRFPLESPLAPLESESPLIPLSLPHGILYLSAYSTGQPDTPDSLTHHACAPLHQYWTAHSSPITKKDLHTWLRLHFFKEVHLGMYENRPIYFPLSSQNKNFVAHISIHRWHNNTLKTLLANYLTHDLRTLEGELTDLESARAIAAAQGNAKAKGGMSDRQDHIRTLHTELVAFIALVRQCAEVGPPPATPTDPKAEAEKVSYQMNLDDGVMINSAALWPLLAPQWSKPAKNCPQAWWHELTTAKDRKDYDWSHLAARYFPTRVDAKCQQDPSLAVAHGCFWQHHPAKATEWELRLQDEIGSHFTIDEENSDTLRQQFETAHPDIIKELKEKEEKRRERKYKKQEKEQLSLEI